MTAGAPTLGGVKRLAALPHSIYTVATVPPAASFTGAAIYVSNGATNSPTLAFSNGTNWLRVDTLAAIST